MKIRFFLLIALALLATLVSFSQDTGWGKHKRMFAVPAPGKVVVDGKLNEWDLSGAITIYVMAATMETQSAKFAIMYDKDALYLGAEVRDPTPLLNRHSPEAEGDMAWDADACQFRLVVDPAQGYPVTDTTWNKERNDQLQHLLLWYYTDRQEANLQMGTSMAYTAPPDSLKFGVLKKDKFQAAYRLADDKKGYSFEYRIPWSTLGAKRPLTGGDVVAATVQFDWGRADGLKTAGISGWGYDLMSFAGFAYQNAGCWGKLIFSKTGHLPKSLVDEGLPPEKPLPLTFSYDLPEDSEATVALVNDKQEVVRTLAASAPRLGGPVTEKWDGLDELGKPLPAGKYTWKGLYHQPIKTQYVLSVHNSGQPAWKTDQNTGGWGGDHGAPIAICRAGTDLVLAWDYAEAGWGLIRTDGEGKKKWGVLHCGNHVAANDQYIYLAEGDGVHCYDLKDGRPVPFSTGQATLTPLKDQNGVTGIVSGLACDNADLYVAYGNINRIGIFDAKTNNLIVTSDMPNPGALAKYGQHWWEVAALSDGKLAAVVTGKGNSQILATDHLDDPDGLTVDAAGNFYVANRGKLQNVSVFSPEGKYLRSIGKAGGRPRIGRFDPAGMLQPAGLTIDAQGRLWVMECIDSPKRVSVWDAQTGTLAREFFGDAHYSSFIWMDPARPNEVYCDGTLWTVDLDKHTSYPYSTVWRGQDPNAPADLATHGGGLHLFTAKNGKQYGWATDARYSSVLFIRDGDVVKPLLSFLYGHAKGAWPTDAIPYPAAADAFRDPALQQKYPWGATFAWADANGDGVIQPGEISKELGGDGYRGFSCVDRDLNLWHGSGQVFRPVRIEADGRPVYDFAKPEKVPIAALPEAADPEDGSLYALNENGDANNIGFARFQPDGKLLWGYRGVVPWPQALSLPPQRAGKLWGATVSLGSAGDFTGFATYFGTHHLYTRDGLAVAMIFRDPRMGGELGPDIIACENMNGQLVKPQGMNRYFALGGDQDGRITEILGLDTVKRLPGGEYVISDADAKKVADAQAAYQAQLAKGQKLVIARGRKALDSAQPVAKSTGPTQSFEARAAYDEKNLYVKFDVTSPAELVNGITDPFLIFKGGNCLDIQLAADPKADPKRQTGTVGDVRILVTRQNGKPLAMVYRPKVKGFTGQPFTFRTGNTETFDSIAPAEQVGLEYRYTATQGAFTAVVTIPLQVLNWTPQPGTAVRMDLGYIFGNNEGTKAMVRSYWSNNGFSANVLNDVPNESKLVPGEWGMAEVE